MSEYFRVNNSETDFATAVTFSRSGTAMKINSLGLLVEVSDGVARRNAYYYNSSNVLTKGGLLLESAAATNLIANSNSFTSIQKGTGTQDATGPDGTTSAWTIVDDGSTGSGQVYESESVTVATETTYTASIFAKADQNNWITISAIGFTTPSNSDAFFDLANGVIGTVDAGIDDARMEYYGNGWWRCSITFTTDASDTSGFIRNFVCATDNSTNITLDGTNSVLMYGKQFEEGPIATSYIPTSGSTVARAAETLIVPSTNVPETTAGTSIVLKALLTYADTNSSTEAYFVFWQDSAANEILIRLITTDFRTGQIRVAHDSGTQVVVNSAEDAYSPGINVPFSIASYHTSSVFGVVTNGTFGEEDTIAGMPDLGGTDIILGQVFNGFISELRVFATSIGQTGGEEVTS